jgi:hypothetical protein
MHSCLPFYIPPIAAPESFREIKTDSRRSGHVVFFCLIATLHALRKFLALNLKAKKTETAFAETLRFFGFLGFKFSF